MGKDIDRGDVLLDWAGLRAHKAVRGLQEESVVLATVPVEGPAVQGVDAAQPPRPALGPRLDQGSVLRTGTSAQVPFRVLCVCFVVVRGLRRARRAKTMPGS